MRKKKGWMLNRIPVGKKAYRQDDLKELIVSSSAVSKNLSDMDKEIQNFKASVVSSVIDLSDF